MRGTRKSRCVLDAHGRQMHCHHEQLVIVERRAGVRPRLIDLTALAGGNSNEHPTRRASAGTTRRPRADYLRDVAAHFALRWEAATGEALAVPEEPARAGTPSRSSSSTTMPENAEVVLPHGGLALEAYVRALRSTHSV